MSALSSLPRTIATDVIGVAASISSVCFSRSRLIDPAVAIGARNDDQQRLEHQDRGEDALPDRRGRERRVAAEAGRVRPLHDQLDHPGEAGEQQEVEGQDHERPPAAHPAAEFLDADRTDRRRPCAGEAERRSAPRRITAVVAAAGLVGQRPGGDLLDRCRSPSSTSAWRSHRSLGRIGVTIGFGIAQAASTGARSPAVTCRKSSSRSLAARAKLTTGRPAATASARSRADAASSPRKPSSIVPSARIVADATSGSRRESIASGRELVAVEQDADAQHGPEAEPPLDVGDAALGEDLAAIDDRDAGAQLLELGQDVAADDDGLAHRTELAEELAKLDPRARVETGRRLVEEQHLRVVDERVGEAQPLLHAARQVLDVGVALVAEIDQLEQVADHPAPAGRRQPVAAGEEVEVLPDLHVVVDPERVRHEPEDAPDLVGVPGHRPAGDLGLPASGRRSVASIRRVVVLPAPFGPTSPKISPWSMSRSMPATASVRS